MIIPIMVGEVNEKSLNEYAQALFPYFMKDETVFLVSSDFCHWGERFDYQYKEGSGKIWERIQRLDMQGIQHIEN